MTRKLLDPCIVRFFAASSRVAHAYRLAVNHKKSLARRAVFAELRNLLAPHHSSKGSHELKTVVLSHADDDYLVLKDALAAPMLHDAFHLLFTEPATHPDQVAQWMRGTKIRAESRLHVVKVDSLEAPRFSELLGRVCFALGGDKKRGGIIDAYLLRDKLLVRGPENRMLHVPLHDVKALRGQPRAVLQKFVIDPDGSFIFWPDIDVHLGWNQLLQATDPAELHKAQQRSAGFNQRYGNAIRKCREAAGISQAKVPGITDRQLRRIESGESRATTAALTALAAAHGQDVNDYMEKLAKEMS